MRLVDALSGCRVWMRFVDALSRHFLAAKLWSREAVGVSPQKEAALCGRHFFSSEAAAASSCGRQPTVNGVIII